MQIYTGSIVALENDEVFVFDSNAKGFHGANYAGYASFGVNGNQWRRFNYGQKDNGWKGRWNVKGCGSGMQRGTDGSSYALPTMNSHLSKVGIDKERIIDSITELYKVVVNSQPWKFLVCYKSGDFNLNAYSPLEMAGMFHVAGQLPPNIYFHRSFAELILKFSSSAL